MQYLIQMSDEFRESYTEIKEMEVKILDEIEQLKYRVLDVETRLNPNRED